MTMANFHHFQLNEANGRWFEYNTLDNLPHDFDLHGFEPEGATHWVRISDWAVGTLPAGMSPFRIAKVLKTVAYVWNEDDHADKWQIKNNR